ncbi:MAG: hypothetical protein U1F56_22635 [Rubrivivax sp.]
MPACHAPRRAAAAAAALLATLLAACGGGDDDRAPLVAASGDRAQATVDALSGAAAGRLRARSASTAAAAAAAGAVPAAYDPEESARQLMDFGEARFPSYFPSHQADSSYAPFVYRYYGGSGVYLGVALDEAGYVRSGVYVMGGEFGQQPRYVGRVTDFITPAAQGFRAAPALDKVAVLQGGSTTVRVDLERLRGYPGAVQLSLDGLPAGASAAPVLVTPGASFADITISAAPGAAHSLPTTARLTASGAFGTRTVATEQAVTVTVRGAPGSVDTSYGGGAQITPVANSEDYAHAVAVQADGKVVTVGTTAISTGTVVALTRHLRDGGLDPSFGNGGKVITQVGARGDSARAVAIQPDGRIVVAGWTDQTGTDANVLVLRYRGDGTLDPGFGDAGRTVLPLGNGTDRAHAVAIQDDGRIVVGGTTLSGTSTSGQDFALMRLMPDGTLDAGFGNGGKVVTAMQSHSSSDVVYALALPVIGGEQRILAVGGEGDFIAARYRPDGTLDASFGNGGKVLGLFGRNIGAARAVTLLPGGGMVLAGGIYNDFAAAQLTAAGTLDAGFGQGGLVTVAVSPTNWDNATAIARQADGKLVLGGWTYAGNSSSADFTALRLTGAGVLDTTFGSGGIAIHPVAQGTRSDSARGLVLQSDERVPAVRAILGGEASGSNYDFALLRLWL